MDRWIEEARNFNREAEVQFIKARKAYQKGQFIKFRKFADKGNVIKAKANKVMFDHQVDIRRLYNK